MPPPPALDTATPRSGAAASSSGRTASAPIAGRSICERGFGGQVWGGGVGSEQRVAKMGDKERRARTRGCLTDDCQSMVYYTTSRVLLQQSRCGHSESFLWRGEIVRMVSIGILSFRHLHFLFFSSSRIFFSKVKKISLMQDNFLYLLIIT